MILPVLAQKKSRIESMIVDYAGVLKRINGDIANLERGNDMMSYLDDTAVKLIETKPMNLLSIREKMNVQDTGNHIRKLQRRIAEEKRTAAGDPMAISHGEEFDPESYDMEIAVPVKEAVKGTRDFPSYLCAHATLKGNYGGLTSVYSKIREWIEKEGYVTTAAGFEAYATDPSQTPPDENITEVYVPVKKRCG